MVTSSLPLRAYLFDGGVVVFGNAAPEDRKLASSDDLIVNLWHQGRRTEAPPWSLADFRSYLDNLSGSKSAFDTLWSEMQRSLGMQLGMLHFTLGFAGVKSQMWKATSSEFCLQNRHGKHGIVLDVMSARLQTVCNV